MKILVVSQYYYPEPFRINDICEALIERGHEVVVVTGLPNYPMGRLYEGYKDKKIDIINGVEVHRCYVIPRKQGILYRFLNYYSYVASSCAYVKAMKKEFDVVFVYQLSPVMLAYAGVKYKKLRHKKMVLYCLDLWPESIVVSGIKRDSMLYKIFHVISHGIYKQSDRILVSSQTFIDYFENEFGISGVEYLPQYAEQIFEQSGCQKKNTVDLMFAGNIGKAQSVETIVYAANETKDLKDLFWHIVGDGTELNNIKMLVEKLNLNNVIFHGRKAVNEMPAFYTIADAMLVTMQDDSLISTTLPGKVQSYMAAGKAIIGSINGETKKIIEEAECGLCVPAEDYEALAYAARKFYYLDDKKSMGERARKFYDENFLKNMFIDKLESVLKNESVTN